ncbi:TMEM175 family protein [Tomitella biformata]|uniref:TMEM175 family protein n=1 Tax=Tomitella biformata TaxID=630403 RepID=UPI000466E052|nr:TMEM175 family protein [Tomitella biformata]
MSREYSAAAEQSDTIDKSRIEAFSDGVIAVAITLLVLDLQVPAPDDTGSLGHRLIDLWPNYVAYVISFVAIGIMWTNHHTMLRRLVGVDHSILVLNLLLLLCIVVLPFTTSLMASYLDAPSGGHLAAVVYAGSFLVTSSVFAGLQWHLLLRRPHLLREPLTGADRRSILLRSAVAPPTYLVAGVMGLVTPYLTLAVCVAMGMFYLLAPLLVRRQQTPAEAGRSGSTQDGGDGANG